MTIWQKIIVGTITGILWLGALIAKHFYADIDIGLFVATCAGVVGMLGLHGVVTSSAPSGNQSGFVSLRMLAVLIAAAIGVSMLAGCGAVNTATGAALNYTAQNGAGMIQNIQAAHDQAFIAWTQSACNVPLGALSRNATGNPGAVRAALEACPVPSMGLVDVKNGNVTVMTQPVLVAPTPTAPYSAPAK